MKKRLLQYGFCALFVAMTGGCYLWLLWPVEADRREYYRLLCDALTVPGVLLLCAGVLVWAKNAGALDGIGYAAGAALRLLIPGRGNRREESYGEHVRRRQKKPGAWDFLVWSGAVTVGISLIFLWLYYR